MHAMIIEWARNVLKWNDADSTEFSPDTKHPVVSLLEEQVNVKNYGKTMRLGAGETINREGTHIMAAYGQEKITERQRHRYEFSNKYQEEMASSGLKLAAFSPDGSLVEGIEWPDHPWGTGVQFHPEYKSKPMAASPLFRDFIAVIKSEKSEESEESEKKSE
jgi:CTP synthase